MNFLIFIIFCILIILLFDIHHFPPTGGILTREYKDEPLWVKIFDELD